MLDIVRKYIKKIKKEMVNGRRKYPGINEIKTHLCDVIKARAYPGFAWGPNVTEVSLRSERTALEIPISEFSVSFLYLQKYILYVS